MDPHAHEPHVIVSEKPVVTPSPVDLLATPDIDTSPTLLKRISWGAIFAGAAVASVLSIWFNLLGLAIGLAAFDPLTTSGRALGIGTVIWVLCSSIVSLFCGGWIAGRLTGTPRRLDRAIHGVVAWSVSMLFGLYIFTAGASRAVAGTAGVLGDVAGGAAPAVAGAAQQADLDLPPEIQQDLEGLIQEAKTDPQLRRSVMNVVGGDASAQDRQRLVQELAERGDMSEAQAEQKLLGWEQRAQELKYRVAGATENAADTLSAVAFLGVLSMFLGLGSSALGAVSAYPSRRNLFGRDRERTRVITPSGTTTP